MHRRIASMLQVVGLGLVTAGAWLLAAWLAFVVAGAGLVALGVALERQSLAIGRGDG
jgi:hypothetical protein